MLIEYNQGGYIKGVTYADGSTYEYKYLVNGSNEITSVSIAKMSGEQMLEQTIYNAKTNKMGDILELTTQDGKKVFEATYDRMPNATMYTKLMYGFPMGYLV